MPRFCVSLQTSLLGSYVVLAAAWPSPKLQKGTAALSGSLLDSLGRPPPTTTLLIYRAAVIAAAATSVPPLSSCPQTPQQAPVQSGVETPQGRTTSRPELYGNIPPSPMSAVSAADHTPRTNLKGAAPREIREESSEVEELVMRILCSLPKEGPNSRSGLSRGMSGISATPSGGSSLLTPERRTGSGRFVSPSPGPLPTPEERGRSGRRSSTAPAQRDSQGTGGTPGQGTGQKVDSRRESSGGDEGNESRGDNAEERDVADWAEQLLAGEGPRQRKLLGGSQIGLGIVLQNPDSNGPKLAPGRVCL